MTFDYYKAIMSCILINNMARAVLYSDKKQNLNLWLKETIILDSLPAIYLSKSFAAGLVKKNGKLALFFFSDHMNLRNGSLCDQELVFELIDF